MQGKEGMIENILNGARTAAAAMIDEASCLVKDNTEKLKAELAAKLTAAKADAQTEAQSVYDGLVKLGRLEADKSLLRVKRDCVDAVYRSVRADIVALPDAEYSALMQKLVIRYANDGDEIIISERDAKRITAAWVKKAATAAGKKLTLSKTNGDFECGLILRGDKYDRDLTPDAIVEDLRERTESEVVKVLGL